jgi:hypothetical protein
MASRSARRFSALILVALAWSCVQPNGPSGCGAASDPLAFIPVKEARLEHLSLWQTVAFAGPVGGEAELVVIDDLSDEHHFAATLSGLTYGAAVDASTIVTFGQPVVLELQSIALNARELLGVYQGPLVGLDVGVGVSWRRLQNDNRVVLNLATLSLGVGVAPLAYQQIDLQRNEDPAKQSAD